MLFFPLTSICSRCVRILKTRETSSYKVIDMETSLHDHFSELKAANFKAFSIAGKCNLYIFTFEFIICYIYNIYIYIYIYTVYEIDMLCYDMIYDI